MRIIITKILVLVLLAGMARAATPELSGLFVLGDKAHFVLFDSDTNSSSNWLSLGDSFAGHTLKEFQTATQTLIIERDGIAIPVQLHAAKIKDMAIAFTGTVRLGAAGTVDVHKATLVYDTETVFPLGPGLSLALKATRLPDGNIAYAARYERDSGDGTQQKKEVISAPRIIARPGHQFSARMGDLEFELKP